ncbi:hypothetical protein KUL118_67060 [Tenacibaculum sp. KUL118]|nr:hypothetical protein KUL118_67060 [Tenacibaculum sp. KUL118]
MQKIIMDILKLNKVFHVLCLVFSLVFFTTCESTNKEKDNYIKIEKECSQKQKITELSLIFLGYSYNEISDIVLEIRGVNPLISKLYVPEKITDSIRLRRDVTIYQEIGLKDTVVLVFPNKERYILRDFKYKVRPHFTTLSKKWGCDFYEMKINNVIKEGGSATFIKEGFEIE